jgi:S-adenosylmethionine hydrolase
VYAECGGQRYLAPDNGLLALVVRRAPPALLIDVCEPRYWAEQVSDTFHGRDIFAPVAAHLSLGVTPQQLGRPIDRIVELKLPEPYIAVDHIVGHVLLADSFGNLITNIAREQVERLGGAESLCVEYKGQCIEPIGRTYGEHASGEPAALFDSQGRLEIAVPGGSAAQLLGGALGTSVVVRGRRT